MRSVHYPSAPGGLGCGACVHHLTRRRRCGLKQQEIMVTGAVQCSARRRGLGLRGADRCCCCTWMQCVSHYRCWRPTVTYRSLALGLRPGERQQMVTGQLVVRRLRSRFGWLHGASVPPDDAKEEARKVGTTTEQSQPQSLPTELSTSVACTINPPETSAVVV